MVNLEALPGGEMVRKGIEDLAARRETREPRAPSVRAPGKRGQRLRSFTYNAMIRELVSFEHAAECASSRSRPPGAVHVRDWPRRRRTDAQALAKLERSHARDLQDVSEMRRLQLVDPPKLLAFLDAIEPDLFRFPAVDPLSFRRRVEEFVAGGSTA